MESEYSLPRITKDGVTVAKSIRSANQMQEIGIAIMRQNADTTNRFCGDGTTTSTIIAHFIFREGLKLVQAGYNPILIKRGTDKALKEVINFLEAISEKIETQEDMFKASMVSHVNKLRLRLTMMKDYPR